MIGFLVDKLNDLFSRKPAAGKDFLGAYPLNVHVGAYPERRYMWTMRKLAIISAVSLCLNIILALASVVLVHKVDADMTLAQYIEQKNVVKRIGPGGERYSARHVYVEKKVIEYMFLRHTVINSFKKMEQRWASNSYFKSLVEGFFRSSVDYHIGNKLNDLKRYGITQNIRITDITTIGTKQGVTFHVKFLIKRNNVPGETRPQIIKGYAYIIPEFRMTPSGVLKGSRFTDSLSRAGEAGKFKQQEYEFRNPLGFYVKDYGETISYVSNNKERDDLIKEFEKPDEYKTFIMLDFDGDLEDEE